MIKTPPCPKPKAAKHRPKVCDPWLTMVTTVEPSYWWVANVHGLSKFCWLVGLSSFVKLDFNLIHYFVKTSWGLKFVG